MDRFGDSSNINRWSTYSLNNREKTAPESNRWVAVTTDSSTRISNVPAFHSLRLNDRDIIGSVFFKPLLADHSHLGSDGQQPSTTMTSTSPLIPFHFTSFTNLSISIIHP